LLKVKEGENFNHPDGIGTGIHTLSILRIKICSLTQRLGKKAIYGWALGNFQGRRYKRPSPAVVIAFLTRKNPLGILLHREINCVFQIQSPMNQRKINAIAIAYGLILNERTLTEQYLDRIRQGKSVKGQRFEPGKTRIRRHEKIKEEHENYRIARGYELGINGNILPCYQ